MDDAHAADEPDVDDIDATAVDDVYAADVDDADDGVSLLSPSKQGKNPWERT